MQVRTPDFCSGCHPFESDTRDKIEDDERRGCRLSGKPPTQLKCIAVSIIVDLIHSNQRAIFNFIHWGEA